MRRDCGPLMGTVSAQKPPNSQNEILSCRKERYYRKDLPFRQIHFLKEKSKQNKIAIVTIPLCHTRLNYSSRGDHLAAFGIQNTAQIMSDTDNRVAGPDPSGGQQLMGHIAPVNWVDFGHHRPGVLNCITSSF